MCDDTAGSGARPSEATVLPPAPPALQACEVYGAAAALQPDAFSALYNWGVALSDIARIVRCVGGGSTAGFMVSSRLGQRQPTSSGHVKQHTACAAPRAANDGLGRQEAGGTCWLDYMGISWLWALLFAGWSGWGHSNGSLPCPHPQSRWPSDDVIHPVWNVLHSFALCTMHVFFCPAGRSSRRRRMSASLRRHRSMPGRWRQTPPTHRQAVGLVCAV